MASPRVGVAAFFLLYTWYQVCVITRNQKALQICILPDRFTGLESQNKPYVVSKLFGTKWLSTVWKGTIQLVVLSRSDILSNGHPSTSLVPACLLAMRQVCFHLLRTKQRNDSQLPTHRKKNQSWENEGKKSWVCSPAARNTESVSKQFRLRRKNPQYFARC